MRPLHTENVRQTGWPTLNHITAYFIVHPTHAASLPDSSVHTNWLFTSREKLAHTRALDLTFWKKGKMHNRSVVITDGSLLNRAKDMQLGLLKALPLSGEVRAELQTTILCSDFYQNSSACIKVNRDLTRSLRLQGGGRGRPAALL